MLTKPQSTHGASAARPPILSLEKALAILRCFEGGGRLGVADISRRLDLHPTIVSRMLATLERHGFVSQLGTRGKYVLGITAVVLANAALAEMPLRRLALPVLQRLADEQQVTTNLGIVHEGSVLFVAHVAKDPLRRAHPIAGKCAPLHATAMGKALLLGRPAASVRALTDIRGLDALTPHTLGSFEALQADLAAAKGRGYTVEREEYNLGAACVASPLRSRDGAPVAAISAALALHELSPERERELGLALLDAVYEIGLVEGGEGA